MRKPNQPWLVGPLPRFRGSLSGDKLHKGKLRPDLTGDPGDKVSRRDDGGRLAPKGEQFHLDLSEFDLQDQPIFWRRQSEESALSVTADYATQLPGNPFDQTGRNSQKLSERVQVIRSPENRPLLAVAKHFMVEASEFSHQEPAGDPLSGD